MRIFSRSFVYILSKLLIIFSLSINFRISYYAAMAVITEPISWHTTNELNKFTLHKLKKNRFIEPLAPSLNALCALFSVIKIINISGWTDEAAPRLWAKARFTDRRFAYARICFCRMFRRSVARDYHSW